jgi:hypothetical protein
LKVAANHVWNKIKHHPQNLRSASRKAYVSQVKGFAARQLSCPSWQIKDELSSTCSHKSPKYFCATKAG